LGPGISRIGGIHTLQEMQIRVLATVLNSRRFALHLFHSRPTLPPHPTRPGFASKRDSSEIVVSGSGSVPKFIKHQTKISRYEKFFKNVPIWSIFQRHSQLEIVVSGSAMIILDPNPTTSRKEFSGPTKYGS